MPYEKKTDHPRQGRPKGEPKEVLRVRLPVPIMEELRKEGHGKPQRIAVQAIRLGLPGAAKVRALLQEF